MIFTLVLALCDPGQALLNSTLWVQSSAEYRASALQTYAIARRALDDALAERSPQPPAVILDLDETALDNSRYAAGQLRKGETFTFGDAWTAWVSESSSAAVPGAAEFLQYARSRGVTPFYVTNRLTLHQPATLANLQKLGFPVSEETLLVRDGSSTDKTARRDAVAARYRVLLYLGDAMGDFPAGEAPQWGTRWFVVPNPIYGSWEGGASGTPCEQVQQKIDRLQTDGGPKPALR